MSEEKLGFPYNTRDKAGRPIEWTDERIIEKAESLERWIVAAHKSKKEFWFKDWCFDEGVVPSLCTKLAKMNERFREAYELAKEWQESIISKGALGKKLDSGFSKFYLINRYKENWKENVDSGVQEETLVQFNQLMSQLASNQATPLSSALKIDESNSKSDI